MQTFHEYGLILEINGMFEMSSDPVNSFTEEAYLVTASHKYLQSVHARVSYPHLSHMVFDYQ